MSLPREQPPANTAGQPSAETTRQAPARVLLVTATAGYVHQSIPTVRRLLPEITAGAGDLAVGAILPDVADLARLTPALLDDHDLLCFVHTSGELPLDDAQKAAILAFVAGGKGFVGIHGAAATLYTWPEYGALLGAQFRMHPPGQPFAVLVEDADHPTTRHLPARFGVTDELYTFRASPRPAAHVLLRAEPGALGLEDDLPLAWTKAHGRGRVYYNALGHYDAAWEDPAFQGQVRAGLRWAAGLQD